MSSKPEWYEQDEHKLIEIRYLTSCMPGTIFLYGRCEELTRSHREPAWEYAVVEWYRGVPHLICAFEDGLQTSGDLKSQQQSMHLPNYDEEDDHLYTDGDPVFFTMEDYLFTIESRPYDHITLHGRQVADGWSYVITKWMYGGGLTVCFFKNGQVLDPGI